MKKDTLKLITAFESAALAERDDKNGRGLELRREQLTFINMAFGKEKKIINCLFRL